MFILEVFFLQFFTPFLEQVPLRTSWVLQEAWKERPRTPWTWVETKPYCWGGETTTATLRTSIMMCWCVDSHWCAESYLHTTLCVQRPQSSDEQPKTRGLDVVDLRHTPQKEYSKCSALWLAGKTPAEEKVVPLWLGVMAGLAPVYSGHSQGLCSRLFPASSSHAGS